MTIKEFRKANNITLEELCKGDPERGIKPLNFSISFISTIETAESSNKWIHMKPVNVVKLEHYFKDNYNIDIELPKHTAIKENKRQIFKELDSLRTENNMLKYQMKLLLDEKNAIKEDLKKLYEKLK